MDFKMTSKHLISQMGYMRIGVKSLDWWRNFAGLVGYQILEKENEIWLRTDNEREFRIILHQSEYVGVDCIGWETDGLAEFKQLKAHLEAKYIKITDATKEEIQSRLVENMFIVHTPDGLRNEIIWGACSALRKPFKSQFNTIFESGPCGNGHVTVNVSDAKATIDFCVEGLGFRVSDAAWMEGHSRVYFLRCNQRHHTFAFAQMDGRPIGTAHIMSDIKTIDGLGYIRDRLLDAGIEFSRDLGSHPLDGVVSFYIKTPEGFEFELASGTRFINEETWESDKFNRRDLPWGHRKPIKDERKY